MVVSVDCYNYNEATATTIVWGSILIFLGSIIYLRVICHLMETFLISLSILIISGLGFLTYRHPKIARQILSVLFIIAFLYYIVISVYSMGQRDGFNKSFRAARVSLYKPTAKNIDYDSLKLEYKNNLDTLTDILQQHSKDLARDVQFSTQEQQLIDSVYKSILREQNVSEQTNSPFHIYYYIAWLTIVALYILSYLFQNLWNPDSIKQNDSTDKTA